MLKTHVKILASIYTALLMAAIVSLLLFGGFKLKAPSIKGKVIQATMVDISQLKPHQTSKKTKPKKTPKKEQKKIEKKIEKKPPPVVKKDPPIIPKKAEPKIDTKALEIERKKERELQKKLKETRKKRKEAEKKRKIEEQKLKDLAKKTKTIKTTPPIDKSGNKTGTSDADKLNQLMAQYQLAVISSVERQWNKPASANNNLLCHVNVRQIPGGGVVKATIGTPCNANAIVKKSILAAIQKADPLPYKGFEQVFSRTATFIFQPQD